MKIKEEFLDQRMYLLGKIRTLRFIDERLYPLLYKTHRYLFEDDIQDKQVEVKKKKGK